MIVQPPALVTTPCVLDLVSRQRRREEGNPRNVSAVSDKPHSYGADVVLDACTFLFILLVPLEVIRFCLTAEQAATGVDEQPSAITSATRTSPEVDVCLSDAATEHAPTSAAT